MTDSLDPTPDPMPGKDEENPRAANGGTSDLGGATGARSDGDGPVVDAGSRRDVARIAGVDIGPGGEGDRSADPGGARDVEMVHIDLDLDDELVGSVVGALRRAADALPDAELDPAVPQGRHRVRRRRRRLAGSVVGASAAAIVAAVALQVPAGDDSTDLATTGDDPRRTVVDEDEPEPVLLTEVHAVLMPDGAIRPWPKAEEGDVLRDTATLLPDGGLATLADRGSRMVLAVFDRRGDLVDQHEVADHTADVAIVGASGDQIVLRRGAAVSTVDPSTFEESDGPELGLSVEVAAVGGNRLVTVHREAGAGSVGECTLDEVDLLSGRESEVGSLSCLGLTAVAVSPDGEQAAVVIERRIGITNAGGDILDQAVVVIDLDDGEDQGGYSFEAAEGCSHGRQDECSLGLVQYRGLAWTGELPHLVVQDPEPLGAGPSTIETLDPDRLRTITITP